MKFLRRSCLICCFLFVFSSLSEGAKVRPRLSELNLMDEAALDRLYRSGETGPLPDGKTRGRAMMLPKSPLANSTGAVPDFFWQNRIFRAREPFSLSRILPFSAITSPIFYGASWFDGRPAIIFDSPSVVGSSKTVRDEIRLVGDSSSHFTYLGRAYLKTTSRKKLALYFALELDRVSSDHKWGRTVTKLTKK